MEGGLELGLFQLERIRQLAFFKILWLGGARDDPEKWDGKPQGEKKTLTSCESSMREDEQRFLDKWDLQESNEEIGIERSYFIFVFWFRSFK